MRAAFLWLNFYENWPLPHLYPMPSLSFILQAIFSVAIAAVHHQAFITATGTEISYEPGFVPEKIYRDSIYIESKGLPVFIYENAWLMKPPASRKDSAAARQLGIESFFTWRQRLGAPKQIVQVLEPSEDGHNPFYIPPAQVEKACRRFTVWGNYCVLNHGGKRSYLSLSNLIGIRFSDTASVAVKEQLLKKYGLRLQGEGRGLDGRYTIPFRRGEQIVRISQKLRNHPCVVYITNELGNGGPVPYND
jgi:hypothetical protein